MSFDLDDPQLGTAISTFTWKFADEINKTTLKELRLTLKGGLEQGETIEDLRRRIQKVFAGTVRGTAPRARLIARTETTGLVNKARFHAYDRSGEVESLMWLTAGDERVRPTHRAANGQIRQVGQLFQVGDSKLRFPGDKAHGAHVKEVANCRCTIIPRLIELDIPEPEEPDPNAFPFAVEDMKYRQDLRLGGMHTKHVFEDPNGDLWLYKPVHEEFRAYADVATAQLAKEAGVPAADVYALEFRHPAVGGNTFGSIQKMYSDVLGPIGGSLPGDERGYAAVQREHIFDWWIGNNDSHGENFLLLGDGRIVGIDKGQAWKYFLQDKLDTSYNPNSGFGVTSYYHSAFFESYAKGESVDLLPFDDSRIQDLLDRIEALDEDRYIEIMKPYLDAHPYLAGKRAAFEKELLRRKREIRKDMEGFYREIEERRKKTLGISAAPSGFEALVPQVIDDDFMQTVDEAGWVGRHVFFGGDTWEDMRVRVYRVGDKTILEGKVRADVAAALRPKLEQQAVKATGQAQTAPAAASVASDPHWQDVLKVIKSVKHHLVDPGHDGVVPDHTIQLWKKLLQDLYTSVTSLPKGSPEYDLADYYRRIVTDIGGFNVDPAWDTIQLAKKFEPYKATVVSAATQAAPATPVAGRFTLQKGTLDQWIPRELRQGKIHAVQTAQSMPSLAYRSGTTLEGDLAPGIKFEWVLESSDTPLSRQNRVRLYLDGNDARLVNDAIGELGKLGFDSGFANYDDVEYLYLSKNLWASDFWKDSGVRNAVKNHMSQLSTSQEKATYLKRFFATRLGKSPDELPNYNPLPRYLPRWNPASKQVEDVPYGMPRWYRFDLDPNSRWFKDYRLIHSNTGSLPTAELIDAMLENNGAFIPTEEKIRTGIPVTGMSPGSDMKHGSATHFFTRIAKSSETGRSSTFIFRADMLAEVNSISYPSDYFGDMGYQFSVDQLIQDRARNTRDWARYARNYSNETLIRGDFPLLSYLEKVIARSDRERTDIIAVFKKHGVTEIGGVPIERAVEVR